MGLADFERRLERGVEGLFGRVFRSEVRPVELARKLVRAMDAGRTIGVDGATLAPNHFEIALAPADADQLQDLAAKLVDELAVLGSDHASTEGYRLSGTVRVELLVDDSLRPGSTDVTARFLEPDPTQMVASLVMPGGEVVELAAGHVVTIGRQAGNVVLLADPNASRNHAEIRAGDAAFELVDLGSTNGTRVNGAPVSRHRLVDGDAITIGNTVLQYRLR